MHYDPPNDHKDYLHRSGRTARAGATGAVVALVEPGQVREVGKMHDAAGVNSVSHRVEPGHEVVRELAESGTPIPVTPIRPRPEPASQAPGRSGRPRSGSARPRSGSGRPAYARSGRPQPGRDARPRRAAGEPYSPRPKSDDHGRISAPGAERVP